MDVSYFFAQISPELIEMVRRYIVEGPETQVTFKFYPDIPTESEIIRVKPRGEASSSSTTIQM